MTRVAGLVNRRKWASALPVLLALVAQLLLVQFDSWHHARMLAQGPWSTQVCRSSVATDVFARAESSTSLTDQAPGGTGHGPTCCSLAGLATPLPADVAGHAIGPATGSERPLPSTRQPRAETPSRVTAARGPPTRA